MNKIRIAFAVVLIAACAATQARAVVVDFTGGTVTRLDASTWE
jgi:hypothetical protein